MGQLKLKWPWFPSKSKWERINKSRKFIPRWYSPESRNIDHISDFYLKKPHSWPLRWSQKNKTLFVLFFKFVFICSVGSEGKEFIVNTLIIILTRMLAKGENITSSNSVLNWGYP